MRVSRALEPSDVAAPVVTPAASQADEASLPWPFAAALIAVLSAGLWTLIVWIGRALLG